MIQAKPTILIIDDDARLRGLLNDYLSQQGFVAHHVESAIKAGTFLRRNPPDLIVLDVMMPGEDGLSFLKWLRLQSTVITNIPVLMLTALGESQNRIQGLEAGADDYLIKPFEPRELVLRIINLLKRNSSIKETNSAKFGDFNYSFSEKILRKNQDIIHLTTSEGKLLEMLLMKHGQPISRDALAESMGLSLSPRSIDVQITRLRKKLEDNPKQPLFLCTLRHAGYVMKNVRIIS